MLNPINKDNDGRFLSGTRIVIARTGMIVVSVLFALTLAEFVLGFVQIRSGIRNSFSKSIIEHDSQLGWRHKPNSSAIIASLEYRVRVDYNAQGLRGPSRHYQKPADITRILVVGNSFVDGTTVELKDRVTEVMEASLGPRYEVINLGVAGYSTGQEILLLDQEGWKYQPDIVVLAFHYNDLLRNGRAYFANSLNIQKPVFSTDARGGIRISNIPVPPPGSRFVDRLRLYSVLVGASRGNRFVGGVTDAVGLVHLPVPDEKHPAPAGAGGGPDEFMVYEETSVPEVEKAWVTEQTLFHRMKKEAEQRHSALIVLYVPTRVEIDPSEWQKSRIPVSYNPDNVQSRLRSMCSAEGLPLVDLSDRFKEAVQYSRLYFAGDPHWTSAAHHLAGEILAEYIGRPWLSGRK